MNALLKAKSAYTAANASTKTTTDYEYDIVARATQNLLAAHKTASTKKGAEGFAVLAEALHKNRKMWTIFAVDLAAKENQLPQDVKENLFYLAEFTRQHTSKVLSRKANVRALIEVNMAVLRGLRSGAT
ncbi:flagellar biosynthesis regulator FlaF [Pseudophaeobacter sp.]|uniref:flagellar biosynthesis regulator FlaF n=1 Tax=Pseudophaeobacter sp. TaxID=1971739 RepID=UPI0025E86843|nr:flagellar biosynthesis regulator FlaF [uncultured Pseudophaeobacter sp.]